MSSYFDNAQARVREDFDSISIVESNVIHDVRLVAGDRETPDQIRGDLMGIIATGRYDNPKGMEDLPRTKGYKLSNALKLSWMVEQIHSYFHEIARQNITTRFGWLNDNPKDILNRRHTWVKDNFK